MAQEGKFFDNIALTTDRSAVGIPNRFASGLSIASYITGTPVGSLIVEGSNDLVLNPVDIAESSWIEITPYTEAITTAINIMTFIDNLRCKWIRLRYDYTSGSGFITSTYYSARR